MVLFGCDSSSQQKEAAANRAKWSGVEISDYKIKYLKRCYCENDNEVIEVLVSQSQLLASRTESGGDVFNPMTVDNLFDFVILVMDAPQTKLSVSYDEDFFFPQEIEIEKPGTDNDITITVLEFSEM